MPSPGVKARIERFWIAIEKLKRLSGTSFDDFRSGDMLDIAERNFQVAIEEIIDVGEHLISQKGWRIPKSYRDVALILHEARVIDKKLYKFLDKAIILRNIIIHNYIFKSGNSI
ncbi:MAG: type VII toxin-antitoxin system HepT family RNase toxin [Candidatus Methanodesulfokora sp.]